MIVAVTIIDIIWFIIISSSTISTISTIIDNNTTIIDTTIIIIIIANIIQSRDEHTPKSLPRRLPTLRRPILQTHDTATNATYR